MEYRALVFLSSQVMDKVKKQKAERDIPEHEAWLYEKPVALAMVCKGLIQARNREFVSDTPDLLALQEFVRQLR